MACLVRVPTDIIKIRMQTGRYKSALVGIRDIANVEGFAGFYRGMLATLLREVPI
jgi:solute carrier family 25 S-adenosylmethionine transporter 26